MSIWGGAEVQLYKIWVSRCDEYYDNGIFGCDTMHYEKSVSEECDICLFIVDPDVSLKL